MDSLLIKNATLVSSQGRQKKNVFIENGKISLITSKEPEAKRSVDAKRFYLLPGVLDPQVHFRDPGLTHKEDLETGSRAAAAGGVTGFFEMPNTKPSTTTLEKMAAKKKRASQVCLVNYNFFIGATGDNLATLNSVKNVCGIKVFMGSSTGNLLVSEEKDLEEIFANGTRLIAVHAEDQKILQENKKFTETGDFCDHLQARPIEAALSATKLATKLAKKYQRRLHILHLTTEEEVRFLEKEKEAYISAEVCPQHLFLHAPQAYKDLGALAQMNPPIREKRHSKALWDALKTGIIDCMATDHSPHTLEEKAQPYGKAPSGMPGVETLLPLMLDAVGRGLCRLEDVVKWCCERPVELYKVKNKGFIREGFDADLVLIDMEAQKIIENAKLHNKSAWSAFDGMRLKGWPVMTIVNGNVVFDRGEFFTDFKGKEIQIGE